MGPLSPHCAQAHVSLSARATCRCQLSAAHVGQTECRGERLNRIGHWSSHNAFQHISHASVAPRQTHKSHLCWGACLAGGRVDLFGTSVPDCPNGSVIRASSPQWGFHVTRVCCVRARRGACAHVAHRPARRSARAHVADGRSQAGSSAIMNSLLACSHWGVAAVAAELGGLPDAVSRRMLAVGSSARGVPCCSARCDHCCLYALVGVQAPRSRRHPPARPGSGAC